MKKLILLLFLILVPAAEALTVSLPLQEVLQVDNIRLSGITSNTDQYEFKLSIPKRWEVHQARLTFDYTHSSALIKARSLLVFSLGKTPLAQVPLDPLSPQGTITVDIPGHLLKPGYHPIGFEVAQHSVENGCEDPTAPELWTMVALNDAVIEFNYTLKPFPRVISAISDFLFDPKNPSAPAVNILYPDLEPETMKAVSLCASGVALRYDYRPVRLVSFPEIRPDMDTIVIGSEAFVRATLEKFHLLEDSWAVSGPTLSVHPLPLEPVSGTGTVNPDPGHALILVTGRNPEEILAASKTLSLLSLPLPDAAAVVVEAVQVPAISPATRRNGLVPGNVYTLASLGFESATFKGMNPIPKGFGFWIPSDSHLTPNSQAILSMNLAYGAAMREDSVLNIQVNDKFVAAIPCNDPTGGTYQNYKVRLLMSSLKPGFNKVSFAPQLTPLVTDQCTLIQTGNLRLTLFENSTFSLPAVDQWIEMPHLGAFMADGFPFGRHPDMQETLVVIPDNSRVSFFTAVNLMALASQKTGFPPLEAQWALEAPETSDKEILLVSKASAIPAVFNQAAPLTLTPPGPLKLPHLSRARGQEGSEQKPFWSRLLPPKTSRVTSLSLRDNSLVVVRVDPVFTTGRAALMEFQSPFHPDRTVMTLTAHTDGDMGLTVPALWKPGVQASCRGDLALIDLRDKNFDTLSLKLGPSYYLGAVSSLPFMDYYANTYPFWFIGLVILACLMFTLVVYRLLKKRKAQRFPDA